MVVEYKSGPRGKAAVNARVVEANARLAEGHCDCAVCARAAVSIAQCVRERLAEQEYSSSAAVHVVERQAAEMGCSGEEAANGLQRSKTEAQLLTRQQRQRERKKANKKKKKKAAREAGMQQTTADAADGTRREQAGMGIEPEQQAHMGTDAHHQAEIVASTLLEPTATGFAEDTLLEPTAAVQRKQAANERQTAGGANGEEAAVAQFQECCEWPAEGTLMEPTAAGFAEIRCWSQQRQQKLGFMSAWSSQQLLKRVRLRQQ